MHAMAFEAFESPEGKIVEIKSQEELMQVVRELNLSDNSSVYLRIPMHQSKI
jgi:hypothetical protein